MNINSITITGNLTRDAEVAYTNSSKELTRFSVACNTGYGDNKNTTFFNCTVWRNLGGLMQYLAKGQSVAVTGELTLREYSTDNGKRTSLDIRVDRVTLNGKSGGSVQNDDDAPQF